MHHQNDTGCSTYDREKQEIRELRRNSSVIGGGILIMHALGVAVVYLIYWWAGNLLPRSYVSNSMEVIENAASLAAYIVSLLVPCAFMTYLIRIPSHIAFPAITPRADIVIPSIFCCLSLTVFGGYLSELVRAVFESLFGLTPVMPDLSPPQAPIAFAIYIVNVVIAPALLEEAMFRGVIMQSLRRFGDGFALMISSILFAMTHGNLVQGPNTLVVGLAIGFFVLRTGSLWTGVIIHFVNNAFAVAIDVASAYGDIIPWMDQLINSAFFLFYFVFGIVSVFYLICKYPGILHLAPSPSNIQAKKRYLHFFSTATIIGAVLIAVAITALYLEPY